MVLTGSREASWEAVAKMGREERSIRLGKPQGEMWHVEQNERRGWGPRMIPS